MKMMHDITRFDCHYYHTLYEDQDIYWIGLNPHMPNDYETNAFFLDLMPGAEELELLEAIFADYAETYTLAYYSFYLPENHGIPDELLDALTHKRYQIAQYTLMIWGDWSAKPPVVDSPFPIQTITNEEMYVTYRQWQEDFDRDEHPILAKERIWRTQQAWEAEHITPYLICDGDDIIASMELINQGSSLEIDQLSVAKTRRQKGLAKALIHHAKQIAHSKKLPLIARVDAENVSENLFRTEHFRAKTQFCRIHRPFDSDAYDH